MSRYELVDVDVCGEQSWAVVDMRHGVPVALTTEAEAEALAVRLNARETELELALVRNMVAHALDPDQRMSQGSARALVRFHGWTPTSVGELLAVLFPNT